MDGFVLAWAQSLISVSIHTAQVIAQVILESPFEHISRGYGGSSPSLRLIS